MRAWLYKRQIEIYLARGGLITMEGLKPPEHVGGNLNFGGLTTPGVKLLEHVPNPTFWGTIRASIEATHA